MTHGVSAHAWTPSATSCPWWASCLLLRSALQHCDAASACSHLSFKLQAQECATGDRKEWRSPELGFRRDLVGGPQLHAVQRRLRLRICGRVAAHHLVLVALEGALQCKQRGSSTMRSRGGKRGLGGAYRAQLRVLRLSSHARVHVTLPLPLTRALLLLTRRASCGNVWHLWRPRNLGPCRQMLF